MITFVENAYSLKTLYTIFYKKKRVLNFVNTLNKYIIKNDIFILKYYCCANSVLTKLLYGANWSNSPALFMIS